MNYLRNFLYTHVNLIVFLVCLCVSLIAFSYLNGHNLVLAFEDGRAHLNIARRIIDSQTPGLTQLGAIWLPLPHLLMLPFIWNDTLWHTGLAGVIPSMFFFCLSGVFLFKLITDFLGSRFYGLLGLLIFLSNPNFLFIQATPMTESVSLFFYISTVYYFWLWLKTKYYPYIIITAAAVFLGTLSRYDNWILPFVIVIGVILFGLIKKWSITRIEGRIILFTIPAFLGIFFWTIYNALIFGNPFYFALGEGSARWFAQFEAGAQNLPSKGNIYIAFFIYFSNVVDTLGIWYVLAAEIGLLVFIIKLYKNKLFYEKIFLIILILSPLLFNIYSLYSGNSVMWSKWIEPGRIYNVRYALQALPAICILITAISLFKLKLSSILIVILIAFQAYSHTTKGPIILLQDITQTKGSAREKVGQWIHKNPADGLTLISAGVNEVVIFDSGSPIRKFVYEGNGRLWKLALKTPYPLISRIVMGSVIGPQTDKVYKALFDKDVLSTFYKLSYENNGYYVYDRKATDVISDSSWSIKSIDTMKTSRDRAKWGIQSVNYKQELLRIKESGANYVTVDTPYDEEFYPYLKSWADEAHRIGLKVWFRGNWSGWEGWNNYPKTISRVQHITKTANFIKKHQEVFRDGDSFTACPECEYGGPGNPLETGDIEGFRKFIIDEYISVRAEFDKVNKEVNVGWISMNPDVAKAIYTKEMLNMTGGVITLDYFVKDVKELQAGLDYFQEKFPDVKILIGEFGAPIKDINGQMSEDTQAVFINQILKYLTSRKDILGVNYWVSTGGETELFNQDLVFKKVANIIKNYYDPLRMQITVEDVFGTPLDHIAIGINNGENIFLTDANGKIDAFINEYDAPLEILDSDYVIQSIRKEKKDQGIEVLVSLRPKKLTPYQHILLLMNR